MHEDDCVDEVSPNFWMKVQSVAVAVVAIVLSLGQWNDTKAAVEMIYESVITHWTNEIEYNQLSQIKVGQTYEYLQSEMGVAQASKSSKIDSEITFYYYGKDKYLLTVAVKQDRIAGYSVVALKDDFSAKVPFTSTPVALLETPMAALDLSAENYFTDNGNLDYYTEAYALGRNALFYNLMLGVVDYGLASESGLAEIHKINHALNSGQDVEPESVVRLQQTTPTVYAISEVPADIMAEALLTRFEFNAYFS